MATSADIGELLFRPATELAELVRSGDVTARELTEAALVRIESLDGEVNAFTLVDADDALAAADAIRPGDERPFAGVPTAIKDLGAPLAGKRLASGSDLFGDYTPDYDAFVVRRMKEAGFVIVGKTATPELGIPSITEPRRFGPTCNPWDLERTPGGSSGGAAAAVAAGMLPVAHGSDGGGSIRIPAACTGLVGLKPSRGRISMGPDQGASFLVQNGALCRTVADSAALLDVMAGYELGDTYWAPPPAEPFAAAAQREPDKLRIALSNAPPIEAPVDPLHEHAVRDAGELLASLGHTVEPMDEAPWEEGDLLPIFSRLWAAYASLGVWQGAAVTGRSPEAELVESVTWWLYESAQAQSSTEFLLAEAQIQGAARLMTAPWATYDVVVMPVLAQRPVEVGSIDMDGDDPAGEFRKTGQFTPFTALFNISGKPAISLPLYHGDDGLPTAVQLVGGPGGEEQLLSLSAQLEAALPWGDRRPEFAAG
ncbi:MAG: amidase [Thermoleophilaceae bacterium]